MSKLDIDYDEELDDLDDDDLDEDDEDEDEVDQSKVKKLKGKLDLIALVCLITGVIGIISVICAFFVGGGLFPSPAAPDNLQGVYYTYTEDSIYMTLYLEEETAHIIAGDGTGMVEEKTDYYKVEFIPASNAQSRMENSEFEGYDLLLLYETEDKAVGLWIIPDNDSYSLVINATEDVFAPGTPSEDMGDPKNYYHTYVYDENNYIVFNEDGTAEFTLSGSTTEYEFGFVDSYWLKKWINKSGIEHALVVFNEGGSIIHTFVYEDYSTLYYNNYLFYYDGPDDSVIPDEDEDLGDNEDESTDIDSTPDWQTLLDTSNVTITCLLRQTVSNATSIQDYTIKLDKGKYYCYIDNTVIMDGITSEFPTEMFTQGNIAYATLNGYDYDMSPEDIRNQCNHVTSIISEIDTSTLVKESETCYSNSDVTITLDQYGKVYSVYSNDREATLYCSNWGTTVVEF